MKHYDLGQWMPLSAFRRIAPTVFFIGDRRKEPLLLVAFKPKRKGRYSDPLPVEVCRMTALSIPENSKKLPLAKFSTSGTHVETRFAQTADSLNPEIRYYLLPPPCIKYASEEVRQFFAEPWEMVPAFVCLTQPLPQPRADEDSRRSSSARGQCELVQSI